MEIGPSFLVTLKITCGLNKCAVIDDRCARPYGCCWCLPVTWWACGLTMENGLGCHSPSVGAAMNGELRFRNKFNRLSQQCWSLISGSLVCLSCLLLPQLRGADRRRPPRLPPLLRITIAAVVPYPHLLSIAAPLPHYGLS